MAAQARRNLAGQGIGNVTVIAGDGSQGTPGHAPFDAIIVSAAFPAVPAPLAAQLAVGGRLVQPVGPGGGEEMVLYRRAGDDLRRVRALTSASFVRLHGRYGYPSGPAGEIPVTAVTCAGPTGPGAIVGAVS